jgi:hypothetical protein
MAPTIEGTRSCITHFLPEQLPCDFARQHRSSHQFVDETFGHFQIARFKSFGEATIDRRIARRYTCRESSEICGDHETLMLAAPASDMSMILL